MKGKGKNKIKWKRKLIFQMQVNNILDQEKKKIQPTHRKKIKCTAKQIERKKGINRNNIKTWDLSRILLEQCKIHHGTSH